MADFDEMWEKLERKGWEVTHHGEKQRTHWLLPRGVECDPRVRHHTYIKQLKAKDRSMRGVYRTRGEVEEHVKRHGLAGVRTKKKAAAKAAAKPASPPVSPDPEPDPVVLAAPKQMTAEPAAVAAAATKELPPPADCPVCSDAFSDMPASKLVLKLDRCGHYICDGCLDEEACVCPFPDCGHRYNSSRRASKLTAGQVARLAAPAATKELRTWDDVQIMSLDDNRIYAATITEQESGAYKIHYKHFAAAHDETLSREAVCLRASDWHYSPAKKVASPIKKSRRCCTTNKPPLLKPIAVPSPKKADPSDELTPSTRRIPPPEKAAPKKKAAPETVGQEKPVPVKQTRPRSTRNKPNKLISKSSAGGTPQFLSGGTGGKKIPRFLRGLESAMADDQLGFMPERSDSNRICAILLLQTVKDAWDQQEDDP
jgi:hypothetical protein